MHNLCILQSERPYSLGHLTAFLRDGMPHNTKNTFGLFILQVWKRLSWKARRRTLVAYIGLLMFSGINVVFRCFCVACAATLSKCEACKEEMKAKKELAGLTDAGFEADSTVFCNDSF